MGFPTIYPTGTTVFNPEKTWSGYTLYLARETGLNGDVVHMWKGLQGFPAKMLPGGYVMGSLGIRSSTYSYMDQTDLVQVDWNGNVVWKFNRYEYIEDPGIAGQ